MSAVATAAKPVRFAGFPLSAWVFALRNWGAMMLALYVAFWLQLESASSAATCVGILSLQTRGQAFGKAFYRLIGTIVGGFASVAIAGVFCQTRDLFFLACCLWLGLCAGLSSLLDGNRAYGTVLSGYTVAIVALPNVDTPLDTFSSAVNRGAAIVVGILAMAFVSDIFAAPDLFPSVLGKLEAARAKVRDFTLKALREGSVAPQAVSALAREITGLHADITALPSESIRGRARADAAIAAAAALLRCISAARVVSVSLAALGRHGDEPRDNLSRAIAGKPHRDIRQRARAAMADEDAPTFRLIAAGSCLVLFEQGKEAADAIDAMRDGRPPARRPKLSLYKPRHAAVRNGLRAIFALGFTAWLLSLLGWPSATTCLVQVGALVGISATNPNPKGFAIGALFAMPFAVAASGITEFLVLDGVDQFQLLSLGMGPVVIIASLMLSAGKPLLFGIGFLLLVYFPVLLSPANPQSYNPQTYLFSSYLSILSVIAIFLALTIILPTGNALKRRWMLGSARADLRRAVYGWRFNVQACGFRDADRIGQFGALEPQASSESDLRYLIRMSDLAACLRRVRTAARTSRMLQPLGPTITAAVRSLDPDRLRDLGRALLLQEGNRSPAREEELNRFSVELLFAADLVERSPRVVRELREGRPA